VSLGSSETSSSFGSLGLSRSSCFSGSSGPSGHQARLGLQARPGRRVYSGRRAYLGFGLVQVIRLVWLVGPV